MPPKRGVAPAASAQQLQQIMQIQQQLRVLRASQQRQASMRNSILLRDFLLFVVGMMALCYVYREFDILYVFAVALTLWAGGFFRLLGFGFRWVLNTTQVATYSEALRRADIMMEPITEKSTLEGENDSLAYGFSCMQGWRRSMEDDHLMMLLPDGGLFGVFDGHSGAGTAKFCGENIFSFITGAPAYARGNLTQALYDGFISLDKHLHNCKSAERSGCTAVVLWVKGEDVYCSNAGDSRCVLCRDGEAFPLSVDHKPFMPSEQTRIERAGGYVLNRRVNGVLALSRAIGDFGFKANTQVPWDQQAVTSAPEVRTTRLNRGKDEFAVIACDGIWDVMTSTEVIAFVRPRLQQRVPLGKVAEQLMDACLSPQPFGLGCDNMSVIIVQFKRCTQPHTPAHREETKNVAPHQAHDGDDKTVTAAPVLPFIYPSAPAAPKPANDHAPQSAPGQVAKPQSEKKA